jgi:uroporphyrinogen decarboxylase
MNRREIVIDALRHKETRPVPYTVDLTSQAREKMVSTYGEKYKTEDFGTFLSVLSYFGRPTEIEGKNGYFKDDYGVIWNRTGADKDIGVIDGFVIEDLENYDYEFPKPDVPWFRRELEKLCSPANDKFRIVDLCFTLFERCWTLLGMENVLSYMVTNPDLLEGFFDRIADHWMSFIDIALEYDIDAIKYGDDWGQQRGLIMGPPYWRRFIKPRIARLYSRVKEKGKFIIQHSCGDCREIFPDLVEIGLDCYQTFQSEIYDVSFMKKQYGKSMSFWGGISTQQCLPKMSAGDVRKEIVRITQIMKPGGGYILGPTHSIPRDVPPENIMAMVEVFQNQDKYFLTSAKGDRYEY